MIASERVLATPHPLLPKPKQRRQPPTTTKNGVKNPIRPVKIFVIDPKKYQNKMGIGGSKTQTATKEKKVPPQAVAEETRKQTAEDQERQEKHDAPKNLTGSLGPLKLKTAIQNHISSIVSTVSILPPPVPNKTSISSPATTTQTSISVGQNGTATVLENGVTLQCINAGGFVPALPLVVTNGIALLQQPIVSSSIPSGGIFLPGVTAVPGSIVGPAPIIPTPVPPKPKPKKKPKRKKKVVKKKKQLGLKEDDDEDDNELAYLLKETTTRTGRISRPVSQPHSPSHSTNTAVNSIFNGSSASNKAAQQEESYPCEACLEDFATLELLNSHNMKVHQSPPPPIPPLQENFLKSQSKSSSSTNDQNQLIKVPFIQSGLENNKVQSTTFSATRNSQIIPVVEPTTTISVNSSSFNRFDMSLPLPTTFVNGIIPSGGTLNSNCIHQYSTTVSTTASSSSTLNSIPNPSCLPSVEGVYFRGEIVPNNLVYSSPTTTISNNTPTPETEVKRINVSLDPKVNESEPLSLILMNNAPICSTGVDMVPSLSSYSSPLSQCESPGFHGGGQEENQFCPEDECHSPEDPMLLQSNSRSRSPFPPPLHSETSLPIVSVSNLTVPEESLCKGELFMDIGEEMLESSSLSKITSFCPASMGELFPPATKPREINNDQSNDCEGAGGAVNEVDMDMMEQDGDTRGTDNAAPKSPHVPVPVLLETTEDANDGEIFQTANYARNNMFVQPQSVGAVVSSASTAATTVGKTVTDSCRNNKNGSSDVFSVPYPLDFPKTPQSTLAESDISMDGTDSSSMDQNHQEQKRSSVWQFVKNQIKHRGISQACGEISEVAEKLSRIARDQFIPIREEEIDRLGNAASVIHVDTPFFSHLLDLPFGTYVFKEDIGRRKTFATPPPPPVTSSELSFTCGVDDVEKFLPADIDLISLPHLTNLDLI